MATSTSSPPVTKMEFAIQMTCQRCVEDIKQKLDGVPGIESSLVDLNNELVLVTTSLPSATVTSLLQETGKLVVFRGYGGVSDIGTTHHGAAVSALRGSHGVQGLVRMTQVSPEQCVLDGTLDGLVSGSHDVKVHVYGDITEGCNSCGDVYPGMPLKGKPAGDLGSFTADKSGRATFQIVSHNVKVWDVIGRSIVVHSAAVKGGAIMCGIIARSSGLFQNSKKVCTCDGTTIWQEAAKHNNKL